MLKELIIKEHLESLTDLPVYVEEEPEVAPVQYLLIKNSGDSEAEHIESANVLVESYAESTLKAACLNADVKNWMKRLIENDMVSKVQFNTSYKDNDVAKKRYRYRAAYTVTFF